MNAKRLVLAAVLAGVAGAAGCCKCCDWCTRSSSKSERQLPPAVSSDPLPLGSPVPSVQPPAKTAQPGGTYGGPGF